MDNLSGAFIIGDRVMKKTGYLYPGQVVSVFKTLAGETRYVVECTVPEVSGMLHIFNAEQLHLYDPLNSIRERSP